MTVVEKQWSVMTEDEREEYAQSRCRFDQTLFRDLQKDGADFTDKEIMLLIDTTNGMSWAMMLDDVRNAKPILTGFRDDPVYEEKWGVDGKALVEKINSLTDAQACFLGGFLRGWWHRQAEVE